MEDKPTAATTSAPGPGEATVTASKNERFYDLLTVISRVEITLLAFGVLFYFISGSISWRFDVGSAQQTVSTIYNTLGPYSGSPISPAQELQIDTNLNKSLTKNKLQPVAISDFLIKNDKGTFVNPPNTPAGSLSPLEGKSSWSRKNIDTLASLYANKYPGLDLYTFIVQGAFTSEPQVRLIMALFVLLSLTLLTNGLYYYHLIIKKRELQHQQDIQLKDANQNPQVSPVWELAQVTLNRYYSRNLSQNNWIFYVSVTVMTAGFGLVLYGIAMAYGSPNSKFITIISSASGVIVQFIGATFLVIYNSTITQAIQYTSSLQKVSTIGTSLKILDSIKEHETEETLKDEKYVTMMITAKIKIAELLIEQSNSNPQKTKSK